MSFVKSCIRSALKLSSEKILNSKIRGDSMLSDHYADQIGYYAKDNNPIKEHFQLEYKNDWRLRYMNFLETRSNQDFVIILLNKIKQFISEYLIVLQQKKKSMSTGMNLQTSF